LPTPPLPLEKEQHVIRLLKEGNSRDKTAVLAGVGSGTVSRIKLKMAARAQEEVMSTSSVESDVKMPEFDWEEWCAWIEHGQKLQEKASKNHTQASIRLGDGTKPVILFQLGDTHIGSWGADYSLLRSITKEICETEGVYVALMGDLIEMAINMRGVTEVMGQVLSPSNQMDFLRSWLKRIMPKVAFSCWGNHETDREEKFSGLNSVRDMFAGEAVYFGGIGHPDIWVGGQCYKAVASHKFRGNSIFDVTFGPKRYMRMESSDREIGFQADLHRPGITQYWEGGMHRCAMTSSTLQLKSQYAQRYFSLFTLPRFPCIVLHPDRHEFVPFWNLQAALDYRNGCLAEVAA
jgi:hypothetical protein